MTVNQNDHLRVTTIQRFDGLDQFQNVFTMQYQSPAAISDADALTDIAELIDKIYAALKTIISLLLVFDNMRVRNLTQSLDVGIAVFPTTLAGTGVGDALPSNVSYSVTFKTATLKVSGRKSWGAPIENESASGGVLSAGAIIALAAGSAEMIGVKAAASGRIYQFGVRQIITLNFIPFTTSAIKTVFGSSDTRQKGRGI